VTKNKEETMQDRTIDGQDRRKKILQDLNMVILIQYLLSLLFSG
jgi:hypothetical protein